MGQGQGSFQTNAKFPPGGSPGPPFLLNSADNGLSVDPVSKRIVLGQSIGAIGNPAILLDNREIPFAGFTLDYIDAGPTQIRFNPSVPEIRLLNPAGNNAHYDAFQLFMQGSPNGALNLGLGSQPHLTFTGAIPGTNPIIIMDFSTGNTYTVESDELASGDFSIGGTLNKERIFFNDAAQDIRIILNNHIHINNVAGTAPIADFNLGTGDYFIGDDNNVFNGGEFVMNQAGRTSQWGFNLNNGTRLRMDDVNNIILARTGVNGVPASFVLNLDGNGNSYKIGEISGNNNGTFMNIDDTAGEFILTNTALTSKVRINGVIGFTGTVANPVTITVDGGIVTNVA